MWHMSGVIIAGRKTGTKSCPLFGHEIEPRMWRRLPTFRSRNPAQNVAQAAHFSGTKSNPEYGTGAPLFGHVADPRMWRGRAAFRAPNRSQIWEQSPSNSSTNSTPECGDNAASAGCLCDPLRGRQLAHVFDGRGERGCVGGSAGSVKAARASTSTSRNTSPTTALSASTIFGAQPCWPPAAATFGR
jgi:hypothetical protein